MYPLRAADRGSCASAGVGYLSAECVDLVHVRCKVVLCVRVCFESWQRFTSFPSM